MDWDFSKTWRNRRRAIGVTMEDMANLLNVSWVTYHRNEKGDNLSYARAIQIEKTLRKLERGDTCTPKDPSWEFIKPFVE